MSPVNATPPTPADYERTIAQHREYIEQLEARVQQAEADLEAARAGTLAEEEHMLRRDAERAEAVARSKLDKVRRLIPTENPELIEAGYGIDSADVLAILDGKTGD